MAFLFKFFLLGFLSFSPPGIDQVSMETQYVEEGGVTKLFRKPTKTLQKSTRRNTLGNRRRDPTATRNKPPTQRRRPSPINGVKQQLQQENLGADNKKTRTSETRSLPNIRRAPTKAANRRRTKSRTRNENSISGQQQVRNQICCQNFFNESPAHVITEFATTSGEDRDSRSASWEKHSTKGIFH